MPLLPVMEWPSEVEQLTIQNINKKIVSIVLWLLFIMIPVMFKCKNSGGPTYLLGPGPFFLKQPGFIDFRRFILTYQLIYRNPKEGDFFIVPSASTLSICNLIKSLISLESIDISLNAFS